VLFEYVEILGGAYRADELLRGLNIAQRFQVDTRVVLVNRLYFEKFLVVYIVAAIVRVFFFRFVPEREVPPYAQDILKLVFGYQQAYKVTLAARCELVHFEVVGEHAFFYVVF